MDHFRSKLAPRTAGSRRDFRGKGRRPADVWWPRGLGGKSVAWDFAVTSGMRTEHLTGTAVEHIFSEYEDYKNDYKDTAGQCTQQGFVFQPLIIEAHGGGGVGPCGI